MAENKSISYLNQDFSDFKKTLIEYSKTYFPETYNDFSEASPGMMFIEMASYVGDVLSFYLNSQTQENLTLFTKERENIIPMAYALGYRPKMSYAASTEVEIYQLVPNVDGAPDLSYTLLIPENTAITSKTTQQTFLTTRLVDFSVDPEVSYLNEDYMVLKVKVPVISATIKTKTFSFTSPVKFNTVTLNDSNIIQILDVFQTGGDQWYEVSYLAQDIVFEEVENNNINNPFYEEGDVPYLLRTKKVPKRFVSRFRSSDTLDLTFGSGVLSSSDEDILPNPNNVSILGTSLLDQTYNRIDSVKTRQYGLAPSNTTLTVRYLVGGGIQSNVGSSDLTTINQSNITFKSVVPDPLDTIQQTILDNINVTNEQPATGGRDGDSLEEIRQNTLFSHASQLRAVNKEDYIVRSLSMPAEVGNISKAYIEKSKNGSQFLMNLYILAYTNGKQLTEASQTLKNNLKVYLSRYKLLTDAVDIKDAYYINIKVHFDITVLMGYNNSEVLANCIKSLQSLFHIDKMQLNQPIIISDVYSQLLKVKGVQSVVKVEFENVQGGSYSPYGYDIAGATRNGVIYPSLDPSVFEVRNPNTDIKGRIITY